VIRPVDVLVEFLEAEQARGVTHVHLDQGARDGLRGLFNRVKSGGIVEPAPVVVTPEVAPAPVMTHLQIEGSTRSEKLASLRAQAADWGPIKALGSLRETLVFSTGNPEARVMFIGEAPGYQEEKEREPFVGPAGQKLNDILKAMGLPREEVYLSNLIKFRPAMAGQTTNNRNPTAGEIAACLPILRAEIDIIQPQCVIALGEGVAESLLGLTGPIPFSRGTWHDFEGTPARVTYHPSTLLQTQGASATKRQLWEDMLVVMEKIGLPISDKQRGFFLPKPS
jgi:uracil-DNA glycosylase